VELKTNKANPFFKTSPTIKLPIAHAEGRYHISEDGLKGLEDNGQIWMTYQNNPNGAIRDIAGVMNVRKNIAALMPHPERAFHQWMGGTDGQSFFQI
jgi:phosphoribosylformylglycinamidine synthase